MLALSADPAHRRYSLTCTAIFLLFLAWFTSGCGGGSATPMTTPPSNPQSPNPPTTNPTPTPTPSGSNAGMYQVNLVSNEHSQVVVGQVTVDATANNGDTEVKLNQVIVNTHFWVKFCPFGNGNQNCLTVGDFTTDASGNADTHLQFPQAGTWAGVFSLGMKSDFDPRSEATYLTEPDAYSGNFSSTQSYRVALLPENNLSGGFDGVPTQPASISSGFVTETGQTLHVEVHGVQPNTTYDVGYCPNGIFGSGCNEFLNNTFTTDASGNGSLDQTVTSAPMEIIFVDVHGTRGQGYVTAFTVVK